LGPGVIGDLSGSAFNQRLFSVVAGLVPAIHVQKAKTDLQSMDARIKSAHDESGRLYVTVCSQPVFQALFRDAVAPEPYTPTTSD
jgi:hypothetical protein